MMVKRGDSIRCGNNVGLDSLLREFSAELSLKNEKRTLFASMLMGNSLKVR